MSRRHNKGKTEGEKPFWISYADLMTGMMVLFLVTMATMMVVITRKVRHVQAKEVIRSQQIKHICQSIQKSLSTNPAVHVDCQDNRISFGEVGRFAHNDYHLPPQAGPVLARLLPVVLHAADDPLGKRWMKQVIIEGYTDTDGSYLYNLHLSLERSEWVMCLLLDARLNRDLSLSPQEIQQVKKLFLAGGVSFNDARATKGASRRVELKLQFYGLNPKKAANHPTFKLTSNNQCVLK